MEQDTITHSRDYARRERRLRLTCRASVTTEHGVCCWGVLADIGAGGAGVALEQAVGGFDNVALRLHPVPGPSSPLGPLRGRIVSLALEPTTAAPRADGPTAGRELDRRIGIVFAPGSRVPERWLREVALAQGQNTDSTAIDEAAMLCQHPEGREQLYQLALQQMAVHDLAGARDAVRWALHGGPDNRAYLGLWHHVRAKQAILAGAFNDACRNVALALVYTPGDAALQKLGSELDVGYRQRQRLRRITKPR